VNLIKHSNRLASISAAAAALGCVGAVQAADGTLGTGITIRPYGLARLDIVKDIDDGTGGGSASNIPAIAPDGSVQANRKGAYTMTARASRIGVDAQGQTPAGPLQILIEGDFYGVGAGNEVSTNSGTLRLRHAYGQLGPIMAGQYWTNAADIASAPEFLDFTAPVGTPNGIRQPQLRYTVESGPNFFAAALENPEGDFNGANNATFVAANQGISNNIQDKWPDVTARYAYQQSWGRFSVAGVARYISVDTGGATVNGFNGKDGTVGYGLMLTNVINTFGKDRFIWMAVGGDGIGRYIQYSAASGGGAAIVNGKLETIKAYAANASYQHYWSDKLRSTAYYGWSRWDNPTPLVQAGLVRELRQAYVNLVYLPIPKSEAKMGVEYVVGNVNFASQTPPNENQGKGSRINMSFQYPF